MPVPLYLCGVIIIFALLDLVKTISFSDNLLVDKLLEIIKDTLVNGEDVLVSGFGKFYVKEKNERRGRNP